MRGPLQVDRLGGDAGEPAVLAVAEAVVAGAEAAADRRLAVPEDVPGEPETRRRLDAGVGEGVGDFLAEDRPVVDVARPVDDGADPRARARFPAHRIERHPIRARAGEHAVGAVRLPQLHRVRRTPGGRIEPADVPTPVVDDADVREADAEVEREPTRHAPVVLEEELGLVEYRHGTLVVVVFGVGVEVPERRVGPPQVGVERIGRVGVEVVGAGVARQRAGPPRPLVEEPGLHVVRAAHVGQVHREVVRVVRGQPGEGLPWPMLMNLVFGSALAPANDMFGRMWFGLFSEKYCWWPGR